MPDGAELTIATSEAGIDQFQASGPAAIVEGLYAKWCDRIDRLRRESDELAKVLTSPASARGNKIIPMIPRPKGPKPGDTPS